MTMTTDRSDLLTYAQVCRLLAISRTTLWRLVQDGELVPVNVHQHGWAPRIPAAEVRALKVRGTVTPAHGTPVVSQWPPGTVGALEDGTDAPERPHGAAG